MHFIEFLGINTLRNVIRKKLTFSRWWTILPPNSIIGKSTYLGPTYDRLLKPLISNDYMSKDSLSFARDVVKFNASEALELLR